MTNTRTVVINVTLTIEVDASSDEQAFIGIFEAFDQNKPIDPLAEIKFSTGSRHCGPEATIKTCVVEDLEFQSVDADWKLWESDDV